MQIEAIWCLTQAYMYMSDRARRGRGDATGDAGLAESSSSAYVDPCRRTTGPGTSLDRACLSCRLRPASVVLLPCRHLPLCASASQRATRPWHAPCACACGHAASRPSGAFSALSSGSGRLPSWALVNSRPGLQQQPALAVGCLLAPRGNMVINWKYFKFGRDLSTKCPI